MAGLLRNCALTELEQVQVLNKVLHDEIISEFSLDEDNIFKSA
jgi:hypothetical protein